MGVSVKTLAKFVGLASELPERSHMLGLTALLRLLLEDPLRGLSVDVRKTRLRCSPTGRTGRREETNEPNSFGS
jgi:hypothetical protein